MSILIFALFVLQVVAAFQLNHHHHQHNRQQHRSDNAVATPRDGLYATSPKHEEQLFDVVDRRTFARNTILTSLALLSIMPGENALAAIDVASAPASTTPSLLEGELTVSSPPPNRGIVMDDDEEETINEPVTKEVSKKKKKKTSDPRFFIAGGASAAISHGITTPIDVVKTRMQSDASLSDLTPSDAAIRIVEAEGPKALTAGLLPTVIGVSLAAVLHLRLHFSCVVFLVT